MAAAALDPFLAPLQKVAQDLLVNRPDPKESRRMVMRSRRLEALLEANAPIQRFSAAKRDRERASNCLNGQGEAGGHLGYNCAVLLTWGKPPCCPSRWDFSIKNRHVSV